MGETASKLRSCKSLLYRYHFQPGARLSVTEIWLGLQTGSEWHKKAPREDSSPLPWGGGGHNTSCSIRRRVTVGAGGGSVFRVCKVHPGSQHLVIWGGVPGKAASGQSLQPSQKFCEFSNPDSYFTSTSTPCCCLFAQSCPTLCDSMDYSLLGSSVHGISQARILEWVAIPFSRGSSQPRDRTLVFYMGRWILYHWATREVHYYCYDYYYLQWILLFATRNPGGCTFFHPHYGECYL